MKCPLRVIAIPSSEAQGIPVVYDCIKEECAWWDGTNGHCMIMELGRMWFDTNTILQALVKKMPQRKK